MNKQNGRTGLVSRNIRWLGGVLLIVGATLISTKDAAAAGYEPGVDSFGQPICVPHPYRSCLN